MNAISKDDVLDDISLVRQLHAGNKKAFDLLLARYRVKTEHLVKRYVSCPYESLDVCQEIYIKLYRSIYQFKGDASFYTWYYMIAINTIKNYLKKQNSVRARYISIDALSQDFIMLYLKEKQSPEQILIGDEAKEILVNTLKQMPACLSHCMLLYDIKGLSYEAIAKKMGCPIGTVRSRIYRARHLVEKMIAEI